MESKKNTSLSLVVGTLPGTLCVLTLLAVNIRKPCTPWAATSQADHHHSGVLYIGYASSVKLPVRSRDDTWIENELRADSLYFVPWISFT